MTNPIVSDTTNSAKTLAQQIAKQMAKEPLEVLKGVREQVTGEELTGLPNKNKLPQPIQTSDPEREKLLHEQNQIKDQVRSNRLIEALNRELSDIHKQKVYKELQERIMAGEWIPLEEYTELTMEQKQVLMAEMEAVKVRMQNQTNSFREVPVINSKPSRRFGAGQKQQAQKEQTRVEKPVPPSG